MKKIVWIVCILMMLCACQKEKTFKYETPQEYALAFIQALNDKDTKTLDRLINEDAYLYYASEGMEFPIGKSDDIEGQLYSFLEKDTTMEYIATQVSRENSCIVEVKFDNHIYKDVYHASLKTSSFFEFVIEDNTIVYIYKYVNDEEEMLLKEQNEAQIGVEYTYSEDGSFAQITHVYDGSVAKTVDLEIGDHIIAVNDYPVASMNSSYDEMFNHLCGKEHEKIKLTIYKPSKDVTYDVVLSRQRHEEFLPDYYEE